MATVVRELHPAAQPKDLQNGLTASRHFVVYDNATATNFTNEQQVINVFGNGTLPIFGEAHPHIGGLVAIDYADLVQDPADAYLWHVRWNYLKTTVTPGQEPPGSPGYWELTYRATAATDEAWRDSSPVPGGPQLAFPANGTPGFSASGSPLDVGGVPVDSAGEPGSVIRCQQIVEITQHRQGIYTPSGTFGLMKKRNANTFLGAQPGRVVYAGISATMRLDTNLFSITHQLIWDEWYHMRQQVGRHSNGEVGLKPYPGTNTLAAPTVAEHVWWVQPLPGLANFGGPSGSWPP